MKLLQIALFLFTIFAMSAAGIVPDNLKINWMRAYDKITGDRTLDPAGSGQMYEQRSNYMTESEDVAWNYFTKKQYPLEESGDLPKKSGLERDIDKMTTEAKDIVGRKNQSRGGTANILDDQYQIQLMAHEPRFIAVFTDLTEDDLVEFMGMQRKPTRVSGEMKFGPDLERWRTKLAIERLAGLANKKDQCGAAILNPFEARFAESTKWEISVKELIAALKQCAGDYIANQFGDQLQGKAIDGYLSAKTLLDSDITIKRETISVSTATDRESANPVEQEPGAGPAAAPPGAPSSSPLSTSLPRVAGRSTGKA